MTSLTPSVGKLLCLSFLIIPSGFAEGPVVGPSYHGRSAAVLAAAASGRDFRPVDKAVEKAAAKAALWRAYAKKMEQRRNEMKMVSLEAVGLAAELQLVDSGLDEKILETALLGYHHLLKRGRLRKTGILSICDFSQGSNQKRLYIIDLRSRRLLYRTYVAHGEGSGAGFAHEFSNEPESHKSSLGFYVTKGSYYGANGLSLRVDGLDRGFNSLAGDRNIVIHGAPYVSERILKKYGVMGTTFGCPAIPEELTEAIIPLLREGSCFFIYAPSTRYLRKSTVLNG